MTTLIITNSSDTHADEVQAKLVERAHKVLRLDTDKFIDDSGTLTVEKSHSGNYSSIGINGEFVSSHDIYSVWYRRPTEFNLSIHDESQKHFAKGEYERMVEVLYSSLDEAKWVNPYYILPQSRNKYVQLRLAERIGFKIPSTIFTSDPVAAKHFIEAAGQEAVVYKPLRSPFINYKEKGYYGGIPTSVVHEENLKQIDLIRQSPGIFQIYIQKAYEIRVNLFGNKVISTKINSQDREKLVDWRKELASGNVDCEPYELPSNVEEMCINLVRSLGLNFGAIDLIRTIDGDYVFLEINQSGQWLWVQTVTQQPVMDAMIDLLTK